MADVFPGDQIVSGLCRFLALHGTAPQAEFQSGHVEANRKERARSVPTSQRRAAGHRAGRAGQAVGFECSQ